MIRKYLATLVLTFAIKFNCHAQTIVFRTHGVEYNSTESCNPDKLGEKHQSSAKEDRLQLLLQRDSMIEVTMTENPDGEFLTLTHENTIKSAKVINGTKGKYLRIVNGDGIVYIIRGRTLEVHGRIEDSRTVERSPIEVADFTMHAVGAGPNYVLEFMKELRKANKIKIVER